jgi:hypothetical protein
MVPDLLYVRARRRVGIQAPPKKMEKARREVVLRITTVERDPPLENVVLGPPWRQTREQVGQKNAQCPDLRRRGLVWPLEEDFGSGVDGRPEKACIVGSGLRGVRDDCAAKVD